MEEMALTYHEGTDGMLYPDLEMPEAEASMTGLGRFAIRAAEYLEENYKDRYRTLVRSGKMQEVEEEAGRMMGILEADYLKNNPPKEPGSTMEMWQLREQARMLAEEVVMADIVMKFH